MTHEFLSTYLPVQQLVKIAGIAALATIAYPADCCGSGIDV
jgi:hypothetical protein